MQNEKKAYETPVITLVKFDASDRITASGTCTTANYSEAYLAWACKD